MEDMMKMKDGLSVDELNVGMRVHVIEKGDFVDSGTVIDVTDGFVSLVDGDEGFGYSINDVKFVEIL
tara:strand:- start:325 stop:525 length:201 start_codon:yes stop_codon:yes gene_type:complete